MRMLALRVLLRALAATWRIEVVGPEHLAAARRASGGFVFALWHRTLVPLLWWHRRQDVTLLVTRHADGELVAGPAARLGIGWCAARPPGAVPPPCAGWSAHWSRAGRWR